MIDRKKLPYRKNCEGYFVRDGKVVALDTGLGYIEFPGGGVDEGEEPNEALIREAYEEAGVIINGELEKIEQFNFVWGKNWVKNDKQRKRYEEFQGEEMHFYKGKIKELVEAKGDGVEEGWKGEVLMDIDDAIEAIKNEKVVDEEALGYQKFQLKILESLKD
jgi:8-oxo-dGTP pyrophosphatase MutT (NUDIX family)